MRARGITGGSAAKGALHCQPLARVRQAEAAAGYDAGLADDLFMPCVIETSPPKSARGWLYGTLAVLTLGSAVFAYRAWPPAEGWEMSFVPDSVKSRWAEFQSTLAASWGDGSGETEAVTAAPANEAASNGRTVTNVLMTGRATPSDAPMNSQKGTHTKGDERAVAGRAVTVAVPASAEGSCNAALAAVNLCHRVDHLSGSPDDQ